jgi:hypothetical protein
MTAIGPSPWQGSRFAQSPYSNFAESPAKCEWHSARRTWLSLAGEEESPVRESPGLGRGSSICATPIRHLEGGRQSKGVILYHIRKHWWSRHSRGVAFIWCVAPIRNMGRRATAKWGRF